MIKEVTLAALLATTPAHAGQMLGRNPTPEQQQQVRARKSATNTNHNLVRILISELEKKLADSVSNEVPVTGLNVGNNDMEEIRAYSLIRLYVDQRNNELAYFIFDYKPYYDKPKLERILVLNANGYGKIINYKANTAEKDWKNLRKIKSVEHDANGEFLIEIKRTTYDFILWELSREKFPERPHFPGPPFMDLA